MTLRERVATLATGKSGKYRYYKCTQPREARATRNARAGTGRMRHLDVPVLDELAERVFTSRGFS